MKLFISSAIVSVCLIAGLFSLYAGMTDGVYRWCAGDSPQRPNWTCYQTHDTGYFAIFKKVGK